MSLISSIECVPSRVWALVRLVAADAPLTKSDLQDRMTPEGEWTNFGLLVNETRRLGLIDKEGDSYTLGSNIKPRETGSHQWFVEFVDRSLLAETVESDSSEGNDPIKFALAWLLTCDPGVQIGWNDDQKTRMQADMDGTDYTVSNASRFAMLCYWARYLGYGIGLDIDKRTFSPDPTEAIRRRLPAVFGKHKELTASMFVASLGTECSVLESGAARTAVESRSKHRRTETQLSPSTSLALLRLQAEGAIELVEKSDAEVFLLDLMHGDPKRVSHISKRSETAARANQ